MMDVRNSHAPGWHHFVSDTSPAIRDIWAGIRLNFHQLD